MSNNQKKEYTLHFGELDLFSSEFKKENRRLVSAELDDEKYALYTLKKKEKRNFPLSDKLLLLFLYEMKVKRNVYAVHESKKKKTTAYISLHENEDKTTRVEVTICPLLKENTEENFEERAENHFLGNPYMVLDSTEKELSSRYEKSNVTAVILIFLIMMGVLYGMIHYSVNDGAQDSLSSAPPPMPEHPMLTDSEVFDLKHKLSIKVIDKFITEVEKFKENKDPEISRMPNVSVSEIEDIPFSFPELNPETNAWEYPSGEQYKRGGMRTSLSVLFQKRIPSKGYTLSGDGDGALVYQNSIQEGIEVLGVMLGAESEKERRVLTESCLRDVLSLSENVIPYSQEEGYISFIIKEDNPYLIYDKLPRLFRECPLALSSLNLVNGKYQAKIQAKKSNKVVVRAKEESYAQN